MLKGYTLIRKIGFGTFSDVILSTKDSKDYALKLSEEKNTGFLRNEFNILNSLRGHPNIVEAIEYFEEYISYAESRPQPTQNPIFNGKMRFIQKKQPTKPDENSLRIKYYHFIVLKYYGKGDLLKYIQQNPMGRLSEEKAFLYFIQLLSALCFTHRRGIIHRDIKLENLFLDEKEVLYVGDFGLSSTYTIGNKPNNDCGSPHYASPEIMFREYYEGPEGDFWAAFVVLFGMTTGRLPFASNEETPINKNNFKYVLRFPLGVPITEQLMDLLRKGLHIDREKRILPSDILKHPWIKEKYKKYHNLPYFEMDYSFMKENKKEIENTVLNISKTNQVSTTTTTVVPNISSLPLSNAEITSQNSIASLIVSINNTSNSTIGSTNNTSRSVQSNSDYGKTYRCCNSDTIDFADEFSLSKREQTDADLEHSFTPFECASTVTNPRISTPCTLFKMNVDDTLGTPANTLQKIPDGFSNDSFSNNKKRDSVESRDSIVKPRYPVFSIPLDKLNPNADNVENKGENRIGLDQVDNRDEIKPVSAIKTLVSEAKKEHERNSFASLSTESSHHAKRDNSLYDLTYSGHYNCMSSNIPSSSNYSASDLDCPFERNSTKESLFEFEDGIMKNFESNKTQRNFASKNQKNKNTHKNDYKKKKTKSKKSRFYVLPSSLFGLFRRNKQKDALESRSRDNDAHHRRRHRNIWYRVFVPNCVTTNREKMVSTPNTMVNNSNPNELFSSNLDTTIEPTPSINSVSSSSSSSSSSLVPNKYPAVVFISDWSKYINNAHSLQYR